MTRLEAMSKNRRHNRYGTHNDRAGRLKPDEKRAEFRRLVRSRSRQLVHGGEFDRLPTKPQLTKYYWEN